jgi:D-alanine-D-alanine ligase-like ATP-grasp enzyme
MKPQKISEERPDLSTVDVIARQAEERGITVERFAEAGVDLALLTYQEHSEPVYFSACNGLGYVTYLLFRYKALTTAWLKRGGFPVPEDIVTESDEGARVFLKQQGKVVIKPIAHTGGYGVMPGIVTEGQLSQALAYARRHNPDSSDKRVVCQKHVEGRDWRVLVINQRQVFAIERIPAFVTGDGKQTVRQLAEEYNAGVKKEVRIRLEAQAESIVAEQGLSLEAVPEAGKRVQMARVANYHSGGRLRDATDEVGPDTRRVALSAAKYFDAPVLGIDVLSPDISSDPGYIIEINATPDLTIHHFPHEGQARDAAGAWLDMLFPETAKV